MRTRLLLAAAVCIFGVSCSSGDDARAPGAGTGGSSSGSGGNGGTVSGSGGSGGDTSGTGGDTSSGGNTADGGSSGNGGSVGTGGSDTVPDGGDGNPDVAPGSGGSGGSTGLEGCTGVTATYCDDFEKFTVGGTLKSPDFTVKGSVVVDTSKAYSGKQALHFKSPQPGKTISNITFTKQFPLPSNDLHGRAMVFMNKTPSSDSHWNFITSDNPTNQWSIGGQFGNFELVCDPPDNGLDSKTPFPDAAWACFQWEFKYPGSGDTTFVTKVDGVSVDQGEFTGANSKGEKWAAGPWSNLALGWEVFGTSDVDVEFWIDDLAFGEQPIACPAKK